MSSMSIASKVLLLALLILACNMSHALEEPDVKVYLKNQNTEIYMDAFKSSFNDEIIQKRDTLRYAQLKWFSLGYPKLVIEKRNSSWFTVTDDGFKIGIKMLTDDQKNLFAAELTNKYGINITANQIHNIIPSYFQCRLNFTEKNEIVVIVGSADVMNKNPITVNFEISDEKERELLNKKIENDGKNLNLEFACEVGFSGPITSKEGALSFVLSTLNEETYLLDKAAEYEARFASFKNETNSCKDETKIVKLSVDQLKTLMEQQKAEMQRINVEKAVMQRRIDRLTQIIVGKPINTIVSPLRTLTGHTIDVYTLTVLPNGDLASGSADNTIKIWNVNDGTVKRTLTGHTESVWVLTVLPNGDLASGSGDKTIKIWNVTDGTVKRTLTGHSSWVRALTVLPNGDLASGSLDDTIKIWNVNDGTVKRTLTGHTDIVFALTVLPNGDLASGSRDNTIKIWNVTDGTVKRTLTGHTDYVLALTVLPNSDLASGSADKTIKIWISF